MGPDSRRPWVLKANIYHPIMSITVNSMAYWITQLFVSDCMWSEFAWYKFTSCHDLYDYVKNPFTFGSLITTTKV